MTLQEPEQTQDLAQRDEMAADRRAELLSVLPPDRLRSHVAAFHAALHAIAGAERPPMIGPGSVDWIGLGREAHAAAGHAQLLGFHRIGALLNALERAADRGDPAGMEAARDGLARQLAYGAASPDPVDDPGRAADD